MDSSNQHHTPPMPHELLRPIVENLTDDRQSLCAVSLASVTLRQEAQRTLFRDVTTLKAANAHIRFLQSVASSPTRLALFVHSYKLSGFQEPPEEIFTEIFVAMCDGFKTMRNLKNLEVWVTYPMQMYHNYIQSLRDCTFDSLERFEWMAPYGDVEDVIHSFLPRQSMLKHLGIMALYKQSILDPLRPILATTCPQLVSLSGSATVFKAFCPGRGITTLAFSPDDVESITDPNMNPLAAELEHVETLSCPSGSTEDMDMPNDNVLQYFPFVNVLQLHRLPMNEETLLKIPGLLRIISRLPALQRLILSTSTWIENLAQEPAEANTWMATLQEEDPQFSRRIFENSSINFRCIDVKLRPGVYARYMRSGDAVQEISEREVKGSFLN